MARWKGRFLQQISEKHWHPAGCVENPTLCKIPNPTDIICIYTLYISYPTTPKVHTGVHVPKILRKSRNMGAFFLESLQHVSIFGKDLTLPPKKRNVFFQQLLCSKEHVLIANFKGAFWNRVRWHPDWLEIPLDLSGIRIHKIIASFCILLCSLMNFHFPFSPCTDRCPKKCITRLVLVHRFTPISHTFLSPAGPGVGPRTFSFARFHHTTGKLFPGENGIHIVSAILQLFVKAGLRSGMVGFCRKRWGKNTRWNYTEQNTHSQK